MNKVQQILPYRLIHVVASDEYFTPLVQTQVFEQAFLQLHAGKEDAPNKVEVWVPVSARQFFDGRFRNYRRQMNARFKGIRIRLLPGVDRLRHFPRMFLMLLLRGMKGVSPIVWHFRSEKHLSEFKLVKDFYRFDVFVADIRGIWPAERLLLNGIEIWNDAELAANKEASVHVQQMAKQLAVADGVTAVSPALLQWVQSMNYEWKAGWVVPCSTQVEEALPDHYMAEKAKLKKAFGLEENSLVLGYLGGTAVYQHLHDMVLPLMKLLVEKNDRYQIVIITHEPEKMQQYLDASGIDPQRIKMFSLPQQQVNKHLKIVDLGFLVRHENIVNKVAQPVKLGEYLAAGVPVCVEGNLGGIGPALVDNNAGVQVSISTLGFEYAAAVCDDFLQKVNAENRAINAHQLALNHFSWERNLSIHRQHYQQLLKH